MEKFCRMNGLRFDPLHFFENAHRVIIRFAPKHAGTDHHHIVHVLMVSCQFRAASLIKLLSPDQVGRDAAVLLHKLIVPGKFPAVFEKAGDQRDLEGVDRFAEAIVLGKAGYFVVSIFADGCIIV